MSLEWLIGSGVIVVVWLVRLEAKTLQNEKDISLMKEELATNTKEMLFEIRELNKSFHELDKKIERVMARMEIMTKKDE